ncbi:DAK2 domain-containing protein [Actinoplanes sp. DH11]|uniref:DAK2 domain-containing protein n=1 Tax=Actinoplanes sp. DH11 TaxID=2857011 RepID=UPI001E5699C0|nr:DAK2 domain-containing protein [Actinoplanes sp. DH11]
MLETLDAAAVRRWCGGGLEALRAHQREIDDLNVYPVPDGDTGTNLVLTLTAAYEALDEETPGPGGTPGPGRPVDRLMRRMARGALLGARGNSGVIVSQILRGMADTFASAVAVRGRELARALRMATDAAYGAVARPVEGTVLSVVAAAAEGAGRIKSDNLLAVATAAARAAAEALARTPQQLPVLARAGVVDAGGRGLCLLLDALVDALAEDEASSDAEGRQSAPGAGDRQGTPVGTRESPQLQSSGHIRNDGNVRAGRVRPGAGPAAGVQLGAEAGAQPEGEAGAQLEGEAGAQPGPDGWGHGHPPHRSEAAEDGCSGYGYEVQYLLDAEPDAVTRLRHTLDALGDSLVVVGTGDGTWNVHVHVTEIGPAVEAGIVAGRPYQIRVTPLEERRPGRDLRAAVVVAAGDGLTALFEGEGATVVDRNPSIAELLAAIRRPGADHVVLLPNDANTHAVATSAAREAAAEGIQVSVVPTRSPVQALAALAVRDPQRPFADDVIAMAEAAGACRYGEVCTAQRDALTVAGACRAGDLLGLVDGEVHVIGSDLAEVSRLLLDRMLGGGGELVTCVLGADAPPDLEATLHEHVRRTWPFIELQCYAGGQPRYHLLAGVE